MGKQFTFVLCMLAVSALPRPALGQTSNIAFSYKNATTSAPVTVAVNGTIDLGAAAVGSTAVGTLIISNKDKLPWSISTIAASGSPFQLTGVSSGYIAAGEDQTAGLAFSPGAKGVASGTLTLRMSNGFLNVLSVFTLTGSGLQANLISSYILAADGNQIPLADNDTIKFPNTQVGLASAGTIIISNTGNGPGTVLSVTLPAGAFRMSGLPLLPAQVDPGRDLRFSVAFNPTSSAPAAAVLLVTFADGVKRVNLSGQGITANFVYEVLVDSLFVNVPANGTVGLPTTSVGASSSTTMRIRNTGNGDGQVAAIAVTGAGFLLANLPTLPATIGVGQSATFTVTFAPTQSGPSQARLRVDAAFINLTGTGLGAALSLTVNQGSTTAPLADNGTVTFPNTAVGSKNAAVIQISNGGNVATKVSSVSLIGEAYVLASLAALPATVEPGARMLVTVNFAPSGVGAATGIVQVDGLRINLTGVGLPPPALPAVAFANLGDSVGAAQQPSVGLSLASPYPLDVTGKLALSFTSQAFVDDQAIQFSTGGRSVNFTIPANTTQAIFGSGATQLQFQSGTVAGTITVAASLATGNVNLTPANAPAKTVVVTPSAPQIRSVQIGTRTANSFEVIVSGLSTPRAVTGIDLQFSPSPGSNLQTTNLALNVESAFNAWYQGASSAPFGSQFSTVINITVAGDINAVQTVAVTAKNQSGSSSAVSASLR